MASASGCFSNCTRSELLEEWTSEYLLLPWKVLSDYFDYQPWLFSLLGSVIIGLAGIFPLLVINIDEVTGRKQEESSKTLKILLSFAVGGLLGDVFLHLLPEAWANHTAAFAKANGGKIKGINHASMGCGLWVLSGFLLFVIVEKIFSNEAKPGEEYAESNASKCSSEPVSKNCVEQKYENNNCRELNECFKNGKNDFANGEATKFTQLRKTEQQNGKKKQANGYKQYNGYANGFVKNNGMFQVQNGLCRTRRALNTHDQQLCEKKTVEVQKRPKQVIGYLNLVANCVDNFTHGLAVGGSFLVSFRLGVLTTFAILIHEIPHEIGDFAILLKSGFNRWDAAKAQLMTASGGLFGAFVAIIFSGDAVESKTSWILPFTAGGFLHIGMVTILPELLKETNSWESLKQLGALLTGITIMGLLTIICD